MTKRTKTMHTISICMETTLKSNASFFSMSCTRIRFCLRVALRCWQLREPRIASNCKKIEFYVRIFFFFFLFLILEKDTSLRLWNLNCWDLFEFVKKPPFLDLATPRRLLCLWISLYFLAIRSRSSIGKQMLSFISF